MATSTKNSNSVNRLKFKCRYPGCERSYRRNEHLNRHTLIRTNFHILLHVTHGLIQNADKTGAFMCCLCNKRFTRKCGSFMSDTINCADGLRCSDLLHAHLRRHKQRTRSTSGVTNGNGARKNPDPLENQNPVPSLARSQSLSWNSLSTPFQPSHDPSPNEETFHSSGQIGILPPDQEQYLLPEGAPEDDYTWLFQEGSLFDLPQDDYLDLHFDGGLSTPSVRQSLSTEESELLILTSI